MSKSTIVVIAILLSALIGGLFLYNFFGEKEESNTNTVDTPSTPEQNNSDIVDSTELTDENDRNTEGNQESSDELSKAGTYESYGAEKISLAENGDVVIFFHASWCPSCRALNNDIEENKENIPTGLTVLKADYDKETELRKKYGVTTQHTLVQVDSNGNQIKKWSGGSKLTNLLSQVE